MTDRISIRQAAAGFAVLFATLVGVLLWVDGPSSGQGGFQSLAAPYCQPLWVDGAQNDRALNCYLTTETTRLCRKEERDHLASLLSSYRTEAYKFTGKSMWSLLFEPAGPQGGLTPADLVKMGKLSQDRLNGHKPTPEERLALQAYAQDLQNRMVKSNDDFKKSDFAQALKLKPLGDHVLTKGIENLSKQGLMLKADYGWWADTLVEQAIWGYVEKPAACRG